MDGTKAAEYVPRVEDGREAVLEAVREATGAGSWDPNSVQAFLMGEGGEDASPTRSSSSRFWRIIVCLVGYSGRALLLLCILL